MVPKRRNPTSPGVILQEEFLKPLGWTAKDLAQKLGGSWSELQVSAFLKGKICLAEEEIVQLCGILGTTPMFWLRLQSSWKDWKKAA